MSAFTLHWAADHGASGRADATPLDPQFERHLFGVPQRLPLDEPVMFRAWKDNLPDLSDYLSTGHDVYVLSKRMVARVSEIDDTAFETYDVLLVDSKGRPVAAGGQDYVIFQPTVQLDALDHRDAGFRRRSDGSIRSVTSLALIEPPGGFPSVFTVKGATKFGPLFNDEARASFDGLVGIRLIPVPTRREDPLVS